MGTVIENLEKQVKEITPNIKEKGDYWWGVKIGLETSINIIKDKHPKELVYDVPYQFNVEITTNNYLIGDTNDSSNWDTFKIKLPEGNWGLHNKEGNKITLRLK